jgi:hypothetical protein
LLSSGEPLKNSDALRRSAEALLQPLTLQPANLHVVERHVVPGGAAQGEPVVVDGLHALLVRLALDLRARGRVEVNDQGLRS